MDAVYSGELEGITPDDVGSMHVLPAQLLSQFFGKQQSSEVGTGVEPDQIARHFASVQSRMSRYFFTYDGAVDDLAQKIAERAELAMSSIEEDDDNGLEQLADLRFFTEGLLSTIIVSRALAAVQTKIKTVISTLDQAEHEALIERLGQGMSKLEEKAVVSSQTAYEDFVRGHKLCHSGMNHSLRLKVQAFEARAVCAKEKSSEARGHGWSTLNEWPGHDFALGREFSRLDYMADAKERFEELVSSVHELRYTPSRDPTVKEAYLSAVSGSLYEMSDLEHTVLTHEGRRLEAGGTKSDTYPTFQDAENAAKAIHKGSLDKEHLSQRIKLRAAVSAARTKTKEWRTQFLKELASTFTTPESAATEIEWDGTDPEAVLSKISGMLPVPKTKKRKPRKKKGSKSGQGSEIGPDDGETSTIMTEEDAQTELVNEPSISPSEGVPGEVPNIAQAVSSQSPTLKRWATGFDWAEDVEAESDDGGLSKLLEKWGIQVKAA
ncbi:hypothetical protein EHS25_009642 [Saitozyma podzolica]|uniref:Uncharacterized protein n=1 Tax=Saitozyma podzolica TaxID=1890683 RepID=A0A427YJU1_9TREE|nr:hypothetical protein EHS25_009642 [Saitozyma podzolica]